MNFRTLILTAPLAVVLACGGSTSTGTGSAALDAATPSFAALALDQTDADTSPPAATLLAVPETALVAQMSGPGGGCHPHLFMREREVVERVNRHIYKVLRHVEKVIAIHPGELHRDVEDLDPDRIGRRHLLHRPAGRLQRLQLGARGGPDRDDPAEGGHVRRDRPQRLHRRARGQGNDGGGLRAAPRRLPRRAGRLGHARGPLRRVGCRPEDRGEGHRHHLGPRRQQVRRRDDPHRPLPAPQRRVRLLPRAWQGRQPEDPGRDGLPLRDGPADHEPGPASRERPDGLPLVQGRRRHRPRPQRRSHLGRPAGRAGGPHRGPDLPQRRGRAAHAHRGLLAHEGRGCDPAPRWSGPPRGP